jgi:hypothetical protein
MSENTVFVHPAYRIALAARLDPQHPEAILLVAGRDALY